MQGLDCLSLPTVYHESKGISALEALANAVPLVLPEHGVFPELIAATGGGVLHGPDDPRALADALRRLMAEPAETAQLGAAGQQVIHRDHQAAAMAQQTLELYQRIQAGPLT